ncbi:Uncharacterised protein [Collinsella intestinalis]|nr:Uncharacterised protein [Collinsella intestinalis]
MDPHQACPAQLHRAHHGLHRDPRGRRHHLRGLSDVHRRRHHRAHRHLGQHSRRRSRRRARRSLVAGPVPGHRHHGHLPCAEHPLRGPHRRHGGQARRHGRQRRRGRRVPSRRRHPRLRPRSRLCRAGREPQPPSGRFARGRAAAHRSPCARPVRQAAAPGEEPEHPVRHPRRRQGRRQRQLRSPSRPVHGPRRRVRLRQVHHHQGDHEPHRPQRDRYRRGPLRRYRPAQAHQGRASQAARPRDCHGLSGRPVLPEPVDAYLHPDEAAHEPRRHPFR